MKYFFVILSLGLFLAACSGEIRYSGKPPVYPSKPAVELRTQKSKPVLEKAKWINNYGKISRLYPDRQKFYFSLSGGRTMMAPAKDYYYIPVDHPNYTALKDLLYLAAENSWTVYARPEAELDAFGFAPVLYLVVNPCDRY